MGTLTQPSTRRWRIFSVVIAALVLTAGVLLWSRGASLPIKEASRFLHTKTVVGTRAPVPDETPVDPEQIATRFSDARAAFADARYKEAAADFAWVVQHDPQGPHAGPAQWNLTRSRLRTGDGNGALSALEDLLGHYVDYLGDESPLLRQGLEQMAAGQMSSALQTLQAMIDAQPDSEFVPLAYAQIARIHWIHGEPFEMVGAFGKMFASVKDPPAAYTDLGERLRRYADGDPTIAKEFSQAAHSSEDGFRDIYQYLAARNLLEHRRFDATEAALERLREAHPGGDFTHIVDLEHAWNLLYNGQPSKALALFIRLSRLPAPSRAQAFDRFFDLRAELPMGIGRSLAAMGEYERAIGVFQAAIRDNPQSFYDLENRVGLALAYEKLGQLNEATTALRTAIEIHSDDPNLQGVRQQLARIEAAL